ncbi:MAG: hypothetical protein ACREJX_15440, partial [Polyangiaceae bacterium]
YGVSPPVVVPVVVPPSPLAEPWPFVEEDGLLLEQLADATHKRPPRAAARRAWLAGESEEDIVPHS